MLFGVPYSNIILYAYANERSHWFDLSSMSKETGHAYMLYLPASDMVKCRSQQRTIHSTIEIFSNDEECVAV